MEFEKGTTKVNLARKGLTAFPLELLEIAETLEILDLSGNEIRSIPDDMSSFLRLRILFLSNNVFKELPKALGRCPALEMIAFKSCGVQIVPEESLPQQLRWLILTDNDISTLPAALGCRERLQKLMLSCNSISHLPDLSRCKNLELIRLASNRFDSIPNLFDIPSLAWVALAGNPLTLGFESNLLLAPQNASLHYNTIDVHEKLGEGASGHIYRATSKSGEPMALKIFKSAFTSDGTPQSELAAGVAAGAHPNLLTPLAIVTGHPEGRLAAALPLLSTNMVTLAGPPSFASCTRDVYPDGLKFTSPIAQRLLKSIRSALEHLHSHGIIHGDVYAHNILWDPSTGEAFLSDLGAAVLISSFPEDTAERLRQIEWRAFSILEKEILERCSV